MIGLNETLCNAADSSNTLLCLLCIDPSSLPDTDLGNLLDKADVLIECVARSAQLLCMLCKAEDDVMMVPAQRCVKCLSDFLPQFITAHTAVSKNILKLYTDSAEDAVRREERMQAVVALLKGLDLTLKGLTAAGAARSIPLPDTLPTQLHVVLQNMLQYHDVSDPTGTIFARGCAWGSQLNTVEWHRLSVWRVLDLILTFFATQETLLNKSPVVCVSIKEQAQVLALSASILVGVSKRKEHALVSVLRCVRTVLPTVLTTPTDFLPLTVPSSAPTPTVLSSVEELLRKLLEAMLNALSMQSKKHGGLAPAILATCLQEALFTVQDPQLRYTCTKYYCLINLYIYIYHSLFIN